MFFFLLQENENCIDSRDMDPEWAETNPDPGIFGSGSRLRVAA